MFSTPLDRLRLIAFLEGVSFLALGAAMLHRYFTKMSMGVSITGMVHGILVVLFVLALAQVMLVRRWSLGRGSLVFISMLIPFGTFIMDSRLKKWGTEQQPVGKESPER